MILSASVMQKMMNATTFAFFFIKIEVKSMKVAVRRIEIASESIGKDENTMRVGARSIAMVSESIREMKNSMKADAASIVMALEWIRKMENPMKARGKIDKRCI